VGKPPTNQDTADEEVQSVVFPLGSVEPRLPFGWLQMFAVLVETGGERGGDPPKKKKEKRGRRLWERSRIIYAVLSEYYNCMHILCSRLILFVCLCINTIMVIVCARKVQMMLAKLCKITFGLSQAESQR